MDVIPKRFQLTRAELRPLNAPMVRRNRASVFHRSPVGPIGNFVANLPDLLTPDHIFEVQRLSISHHPLGNSAT